MQSTGAASLRRLLLFSCLLLWIVPAPAQEVQRGARVIQPTRQDVSLPLRELATYPPPLQPRLQTLFPKHPLRPSGSAGVDTAVQQLVLPNVTTTNLLNFDGISGTMAGGATPPDTNGSVGGTQFVEIVNFDFAVYDKTTGAVLLAPTRINTIWAGFGGLCETIAGGDPVVLWDKAAQRWLLTELSYNGTLTSNFVCIAVSTSSDAAGSYNRYAYSFGTTLPDYPKYGIWPDAYYLSVNAFGAGFGEPCALDRTAMLAGATAAMICFPAKSPNSSFLPSDMDGTTPPPAGAPNHFVELGTSGTTLNEFDFHVDFVNPTNSTFTGPNAITVKSYSLACGGGTCIKQPSPGTTLDSLGDRLMFRLAYRNFGDHESMVVAHSVKPSGTSTALSAVRWYELRSTPPGGKFSVFQQGTFQNKNISLWMGSIAMDKVGDIALGMSASNTSVKPTVVYTGRVPGDPAGMLESPKVVVKGTGVQSGSNRWGDYSSMSVDPADDCTFWYSQEYAKTNGTNWATRMVSFKFNSCH
ncbi:MAG: hypothetical protein LAN63_01620 [Acidobacteriia bacterium]|nr:hypothetical protein [Terriglobia bacterium]